MLQRFQSLLLLVSALGMFVFLGTNSWKKTNGDGSTVVVNPYHVFETNASSSLVTSDYPVYYVAILAVLSAGLSIFTIFQYKNRIRQMLFVALNSLLMGAAVGLSVYHIQYKANLLGDTGIEGDFGIGFWAAFVSLFSNWVANRMIRRDEKLVKSADRMR